MARQPHLRKAECCGTCAHCLGRHYLDDTSSYDCTKLVKFDREKYRQAILDDLAQEGWEFLKRGMLDENGEPREDRILNRYTGEADVISVMCDDLCDWYSRRGEGHGDA